jgi:hypothetical protein
MSWDQSAASSELRLIAACVAEVAARQTGRCDAALAAGGPDWIRFLTLALQHNVAGIAAAALAPLPPDRVPAAVVASLAMHRRHIGERNRAALAEQRRLADALHTEGIPSLPLKGAWLGLRAYRDLTARPSQDLDFLVPAAAVAPMLPVLARCGYDVATGLSPRQLQATIRDDCEFMFPRQDRRFVIEPHWAYVPRNLALQVDMDAVWHRHRPVTLDGTTLRTLAPEDEFAMLCIHGGKEEWSRLKWLADLAAFVVASPGIDWAVVAAHARAIGGRRIIALGVLLLHEVLAMRTPLLKHAMLDDAVRRVATEVQRRIGVAAATRGVGVPAAVHTISGTRLRLRERRRDQLRYVVRTIVTPRRIHFSLVPLPDALHLLYVVVKPGIDYVLHPLSQIGKRLRRRMRLAAER